jgi:iron complex outermembrane recepter protein
MNKYYLVVFSTLLLVLTIQTSGFTQTLEGRVIDAKSQHPLIGVNITAESTETGTTSELQGYFSIIVERLPVTLEFSHIGYTSKRIVVSTFTQELLIEMQPTLSTLDEVTVTAFEGNRSLLQTPGSVSVVTMADIERTDRTRISNILNQIPGVQADQSTSGDTRISIRGAGFRSPFGVRNLRIYLNDIPVTEADGFSRVEAIDLQNIGRVEVIRGPASSLYGAGLGGVIRFETMRSAPGTFLMARSGVGSYGLQSNTISVSNHTDNSVISLSGGTQVYDGFREQSKDDRLFLTATGAYYSGRSSFNFLASVSDQKSQIPGALTLEEYKNTPQNADPGAVALNAGRDQRWTRFGVGHSFQFDKNIEQRTSFFGSFYELDHPLTFSYIRNGQQNFGGRTLTEITHDFSRLSFRHVLGAEAMYQFVMGRRYVNNAGNPGGIVSDLETSVNNWSVFAQSEVDVTPRLLATAGISINKFEYSVLDLLRANGIDQTGTKNFDVAVSPRVSVLYLLANNWAMHGGLSFGFSPPTTNEISLPDGTINTNIEAEKGINYEIGTRGNIFGEMLNFDLTFYLMTIKDELIPRSVGPGQTIYENAGKTSHRGIELAANAVLLNRYSGFLRQIRPSLIYTFADHQFDTFVVNGIDVSGNKLSGIAPHSLGLNMDIFITGGVFINSHFRFMDRRPLRDDNTVFDDSYAYMNVRLGIERQLSNTLTIKSSVSLNNIFDEIYSPLASLNATSFGGNPERYYSPAPGRNLMASVALFWNKN